ncbi:MAG: HAMP domain-containing histidine kinase [Ruminococcus sp.]|nr:HAMP domain-containing histidine kinase [Ruminococcus sp.]
MIMRNNEVHSIFIIQCIVTVIATIITAIIDIKYGIITLVLCVIFMIIYIVSVKKRYKLFKELALDIDRILHSDNDVMLEKYEEGELAILQNELYKMVNRLRHQKETLQDDKIYLSDSIADISHQLRTPLTSINLLLTMLSEPDLSEEKKLTIIHRLYEMLSRIDWLITTLLKISKLDAGTVQFHTENITLAGLIKKSCSALEIPIELREQKLIVNTSGNFSGDISWTSEAIGNIVKNCMEHTHTGGTITINAIDNPLYTEIIISDTGDGISENDLPHIFERFYKGEHSDENSFGIGLALSRMIITRQNGTIKAENKSGAVFTIRFYKVTI